MNNRRLFSMSLILLFIVVGMTSPALAKRMTSGLTAAEPLSGHVGTGAIVKVKDIFVGPGHISGDPDTKQAIWLLNPTGVPAGGVQFDLDLNALMPNAAITDVVIDPFIESLGFELKMNPVEGVPDQDGFLNVVVFNLNGVSIPPGDHAIAWICFETMDIPPVPGPLGTEQPVMVIPGSVIVSDDFGVLIGSSGEDGLIQIGIVSDANLDGLITVQDVVVWVGSWLFGPPDFPQLPGDPESVLFKIFDGNKDFVLNVADAIAIVNRILGLDIFDGVTKPLISGPITVELGAAVLQDDGHLAIPVFLDAADLIAGAEATFSFDPMALSVGTPQLAGDNTNLLINSSVSDDGTVRVIIVSLGPKQGLSTDGTPMLLIPVTPRDDYEGLLTLESLTLANRQAQVVPVQLGTISQAITKGMLAPIAYALVGNAPNPFNPTTTISYHVPQQAHITLTVYNLLGQEVVRLVDEAQAPGRYQVVWNARNARGQQAASGIYLYRLNSSSGYSEVKRMTLLK